MPQKPTTPKPKTLQNCAVIIVVLVTDSNHTKQSNGTNRSCKTALIGSFRPSRGEGRSLPRSEANVSTKLVPRLASKGLIRIQSYLNLLLSEREPKPEFLHQI